MNWTGLIGAVITELARKSFEPRQESHGSVSRCCGCMTQDTTRTYFTMACCGQVLCERCAERRVVHADETQALIKCDRCDVVSRFTHE